MIVRPDHCGARLRIIGDSAPAGCHLEHCRCEPLLRIRRGEPARPLRRADHQWQLYLVRIAALATQRESRPGVCRRSRHRPRRLRSRRMRCGRRRRGDDMDLRPSSWKSDRDHHAGHHAEAKPRLLAPAPRPQRPRPGLRRLRIRRSHLQLVIHLPPTGRPHHPRPPLLVQPSARGGTRPRHHSEGARRVAAGRRRLRGCHWGRLPLGSARPGRAPLSPRTVVVACRQLSVCGSRPGLTRTCQTPGERSRMLPCTGPVDRARAHDGERPWPTDEIPDGEVRERPNRTHC